MALKVGLVGLGAMGAHMARHLHTAGLLHAVGNRTVAKAEAFAREHGVTAMAPREMAAACDVVVTCVTADQDVIALCEEFASTARSGFTVADTSTIASTSARRAADILRAKGGDLVDAPVSGGVEAGGTVEALERVQPVLACFAARITHMGDVGAGQDTKAVNQVLVAGIAQAVCEGLALGDALGLEAERLLPTLGAGAAGCWFLDKRGATMLRDEFTVGFKLGLLVKDLKIVQQLAREAGTDRSVIDKALADYTALMAQGHADEDISALIRLKRPRG
jgi:3-hydroxyisobutyrate dehydrogenase